MLQIKRDALGKKEGKLSAFRPDPKPVFAAEDIDVRLDFAGSDQVAVDPATTRAVIARRRARQHPALPDGRHDDLRFLGLVTQNHNVRMLFEKGHVIVKRG